MRIQSSAFENYSSIPTLYTCEGERFLSPPLEFFDVPEEAKSLVLIMEDPDVPRPVREDGLFVHWILFNIPSRTSNFKEGESVGVHGANTRGEPRYTGPCPPLEYEPQQHRYVFTFYALDIELFLTVGVAKEEILAMTEGHILTQAELVGVYKKQA